MLNFHSGGGFFFPFFLTRRLIKYYKGFQVFLSEYVKGAFPTEENRTSLNRRLEPGKKKKKNPVDIELLCLVKKNSNNWKFYYIITK